jgi:hypothetical protein
MAGTGDFQIYTTGETIELEEPFEKSVIVADLAGGIGGTPKANRWTYLWSPRLKSGNPDMDEVMSAAHEGIASRPSPPGTSRRLASRASSTPDWPTVRERRSRSTRN